MGKKTLVFDLDDTLVKEIDYLKSAFQEIAAYVDSQKGNLFDEMVRWYQSRENVFLKLQNEYNDICITDLIYIYRNHFPNFNPESENRELLLELKKEGHFLGLITDGYSVTQRNKIKALNIESLFDLIVISEEFGSEKPSEANYRIFDKFGTKENYYIGDNSTKDFITPNRLGWKTICLLDNGINIHKQDFEIEDDYQPYFKIDNLREILRLINFG